MIIYEILYGIKIQTTETDNGYCGEITSLQLKNAIESFLLALACEAIANNS